MNPKKFRIGLTAPGGPLAREIRSHFHEKRFPVSRFAPIGAPSEEGKLSDIDGEASFLQAPGREVIADLDFLILAGSDADAEARLHAQSESIPFFDIAENPLIALGCGALFSAAGPPPVSASFTVLLPAAEEGNRGVEELFSQAGDSLNFRPTSSAVFGGRMAFNLLRDARTREAEEAVRNALEKSFFPCSFSVCCARAAIFHGYAGSALLRFAGDAQARQAGEHYRKSREISVGNSPGHASPAAATEAGDVRIDPPAIAGETLSFWFAFDGLSLAARQTLARATLLLR